MALIVDYGSLSQAIADYTHRSDLYSPAAGTNITDYFLQAAQETINKDIFDKNFGNGIQLMEAFYGPQVIGVSGTTPVPADYIAPKFFSIADLAGDLTTLIMKDPEWIYTRYSTRQPSGFPAYIGRDLQASGNSFIYGPFPDGAYTVTGTYYQKAALLNSTQTTNWIVTGAPTVFFAAAMAEAMLYTRDSEGAQMWEAKYEARLQELIDQDKAERWGSATMKIDIA